MTEEHKLKLLKKLRNENEPILEVLHDDKIKDVSSPTSATDVSLNTTERVQRDEYNLTYDELIEEFNLFNKPAIMKPQTFDRLWNS